MSGLRQLSTWPFAEPKMAVLYATYGVVLLAAGMALLLDRFGGDQVRPWRLLHLAGALFVVASVSAALVAGFMQLFHAHLVRIGKENASLEEKSVQFDSWTGNLWIRTLSCLSLASFAAGISMLGYVGAK